MEERKRGLIVSSNDLLSAKYNFTLWQKRIFLYFVSLIEKDSKDFVMQRVYISELIRFFDAGDGRATYDIIASIPKQLYEVSLYVPYADEEGERRFGEVRIITKYTKPEDMTNEDTYIEMKFNDDLKPHLLELKKQFAKYDLKNIVPLQSIYSIRMFEILKSYEYQKKIELDIEYLKSLLEITEKYKKYSDFKRFVIDKSQKDLLDYCDIAFSYEEKKRGKKVTSIVFAIRENKKQKKNDISLFQNATLKGHKEKEIIEIEAIEPNEQEDLLYNEFFQVVINDFGVTPMKLSELIRTYDPERIRKQIRIVQRKVKKGGLENIAGFFMEAVKNDYHDPEEAKEQKKKEKQQRAEQVQVLKMELEGIEVEFEEKKNDKIRDLVSNDPQITVEIIESIKDSFLVKKRLEMLAITSPTIEDYRKDVVLRGSVKNAIINAYTAEFSEIIQAFQQRKQEIEKKIKELSK